MYLKEWSSAFTHHVIHTNNYGIIILYACAQLAKSTMAELLKTLLATKVRKCPVTLKS